MKAIEGLLGTLVDGAPPVLETLMPVLRDYLGVPKTCSYGVSVGPTRCELDFGYGEGFPTPTTVVEGMSRWVGASRGRWGLYDAARVEPDQRNRVVTTPDARHFLEFAASGKREMDAVEVGARIHETMGTMRDHQLRVLVCDGAHLLAWVGGLQPEPFAPAQKRRLRALVPALHRRMMLEARLETAAIASAALPAILERVAGAAFVVLATGRIKLANAAGQARYDRDPRGTIRAIRQALARPEATDLEVSPLSVAGATPCHLVVERPPARAPGARVAAAARRYGLTPRETEVLLHLVQGGSNRAIALLLGCAERTVEVHVAHLLDKVGAPSRSALVARFWMDG